MVDMGLSDILIMMLLICGFAIGFTGFYGELAKNPDYGVTATNFTSFYAIRNITQKVENIQSTFQNASNATPSSGAFYVISAPIQYIVGAVSAGLLVFDVPNLLLSMISDISSGMAIGGFAIPTWITTLIYALILISVTFAIIYFVTSKR